MKLKPIKCKNDKPYIERSLAGDLRWIIYNTNTGNVVGAAYSASMAKAMVDGIHNDSHYYPARTKTEYKDIYSYVEMWSEPEPMV